MTTAKVDGRNTRSANTRAAILAACRQLMRAGRFQPSIVGVAWHADVSVRSVFQHFGGIQPLRLAAIEDDDTRQAILVQILGPAGCICVDIETHRRVLDVAVLGALRAAPPPAALPLFPGATA